MREWGAWWWEGWEDRFADAWTGLDGWVGGLEDEWWDGSESKHAGGLVN